MKTFLATALGLLLAPVALSGCATLTESPAERAHNTRQVANYDLLLFNEDLDHFLLADHPSRLSKWIIR